MQGTAWPLLRGVMEIAWGGRGDDVLDGRGVVACGWPAEGCVQILKRGSSGSVLTVLSHWQR